ncbi:MAG: hypothetical protein JXR60_10935 [Bacteroidales bacterium]|nr:hypothetical protein [Bacteroidales bacterium]
MQIIDIKNWKRRDQYQFFKSYDLPFFNICTTIDVSPILRYSKEKKISFFLLNMHVFHTALLSVNEFLYRIINDDVVKFEHLDIGCTILRDDESFFFAHLKYYKELNKFILESKQTIEEQKNQTQFDFNNQRSDLIYYSTLPWFTFTSIQHAQNNEFKSTVPKVVFGKYTKNIEGEWQIPISVEVHHAIADGLHVGKLIEAYERGIESFTQYL